MEQRRALWLAYIIKIVLAQLLASKHGPSLIPSTFPKKHGCCTSKRSYKRVVKSVLVLAGATEPIFTTALTLRLSFPHLHGTCPFPSEG